MLTSAHYRALATTLVWMAGSIIALNFALTFIIGLLWDLASFLPYPPNTPSSALALLTQFITSVFPAWLGGMCLVGAFVLTRYAYYLAQREGVTPPTP